MWPFKNKFDASDILKRHGNVAGKYFVDDNVSGYLKCSRIVNGASLHGKEIKVPD